MAEAYLGEIRMFAGTFNPLGWALCMGQPLPVSQYEELHTLIGTTYGGDGEETFNLPDLRGRVPVHMGLGPGLSQTYQIGEAAGVEEVTLTTQQIPVHTHAMLASAGPGGSANPEGNVLGSPPAVTIFKREAPERQLAASMVLPVGESQPHENRMPFLTVSYIICLFGIYPSPT